MKNKLHRYRAIVKQYYSLIKPGVLYGNVITGIAGFLLASSHLHTFNVRLFIAAIGGMSLIIGSACTLNNVLDQDIDRIMERTKKRAVANGAIPPHHALIFSIILGTLGVAVLSLWVNWLVVGIGISGFVIYVWLYGALSKRRSIHGTLVGSISGAAPILAGYCAVVNRVDIGALLVFAALFFWQFPEFYSIAIYRLEEYRAANIPVMTVIKGIPGTKIQIFLYTLLFMVASLLLTPAGYTGKSYTLVLALACVYWLILSVKGLRQQTVEQDSAWARKMFHTSLNVLLIYSLFIAIGPLLP